VNYAAKHARALASVRKVGFPVTFTLETAGTQDPTTGRYTAPSATTVTGYAIQVKGEGEDQHAALEGGESAEQHPLNLFFVASAFGSVPPLNSLAMLADGKHQVKKTRSIAPGGTAIATYVTFE